MKKLLGLAMVLSLVLTGVAFALDTNTITVSANVSGNCKFNTATSTLGFGALDPNSSSDASASAMVTFWCTKGSGYSITDDDGLYETGVNLNRMRHAVDNAEFIPYTLTYNPASGTGTGKTVPITLNISGTIANANYVNALAGDYGDTVVLTINP